MLNDLRRILEEDNRIESDLELMMEGTDADMVEMFIDEDGEAEIPESELTKILTKIPEYNQEEELNKKLKRLTESVIPDIDELGFVEEGAKEVAKTAGKLTLKAADKLNRIIDNITASPGKSALAMSLYITADTALAVGIPGLILGAAVSPFSALVGVGAGAASGVLPKLITKTYTKGKPITKDLIIGLLNGCDTKADLVKFTAWLGVVYTNLAKVGKRSPDVYMDVDAFRDWVKDDVIKKAIPAKKELIEAQQKEAGVSESFDDFDEYEYDFMTNEELCEAFEAEYDEYMISEQEEFDDDFDDDDIQYELFDEQIMGALDRRNVKKNAGQYKKQVQKFKEDISSAKNIKQLNRREKDLEASIRMLNDRLDFMKKEGYNSSMMKEVKGAIKWLDKEGRQLIAKRKKQLAVKESFDFDGFDDDFDDDFFLEESKSYVLDLTDEPDYMV